jgi:high-affinity Fe2+/Pb2+ permease
VGKLESMGFLPPSPTVWDTSHVLGDRDGVGGFLGGLVGYRARPSLLEVIAYGSYLIVAGMIVFGMSTATQRRVRAAERRPGVA